MLVGRRTPALALIVALSLGWPAVALAKAGGKLSPEEQAFQRALKKAAPAPAALAVTSKGGGATAYSDGVASGKLGTQRMRRANGVAAQVLEARMRRYRGNDLMLIREAGAADVVVVQGNYDRVQDVLRALKIAHVVLPPRLLGQVPLMSTQTLMINCPGRLDRAGVAAVRRFVRTGGYLVTTDWALTLVQQALPGYIARGGRNTQNDVVSVHLHAGHGEGLLKHVRGMKSANPRWWLESASYPIRVLAPKKVRVLISSAEMKKKYGHGAISVLFRHDDGKVLHMTSHFYLQQAQLRSARERARGSKFAAAAGLGRATVARLRKAGLDKVKVGELNSAYSMQQMTANVLVNRQRSKRELLRKFKSRARRPIALSPSARPSKPARGQRRVDQGFRLRVLRRQGKRVQVRDLFGNEGWTDDANLQ